MNQEGLCRREWSQKRLCQKNIENKLKEGEQPRDKEDQKRGKNET